MSKAAPTHEHTIDVVSPFPPEELPRVWLWLQEAGSSLLNDQGPRTMDAFVDEWLARRSVTWGVYRDGLLGGWVAYEPLSEAIGTAHCIFRKAFWGTKTTQPALSQVISDCYANGVRRIIMIVPVHNRAIRGLIRDRIGALKDADIYRTYLPDGQLLTYQGEPMPLEQWGLDTEAWNAKQTEASAETSVAPVITGAMAGRVVA